MPTTLKPPSVESRLMRYNGRARLELALSVGLSLAAVAAVVAFSFVLSLIIARVFIESDDLSEVAPLLLVLMTLALSRAVLLWMSEVMAQRAANHLKDALATDVLAHISDLGPAYIHGERSGELAHGITQGIEDLDEYVTAYQPARALAMIVPFFVAAVVLAIDPWTVLILAVTGPLLVLFLALIGSRTREITRRRFLEMGWMSASFVDLLQGVATSKMFGRSREQAANIREISKRYSDATMEVLRTAFQTSLVLELSASIATALVAVEVGVRLVAGNVSFASALAVLVITPEFFLPLRQLAAKYHAGAAGKSAGERLFAILDTPLPAGSVEQAATTAGVPAGDIRMEGVACSYGPDRPPALTDVSLEIPAGRITALVGPTGAGKSTIAGLLLRFVEPEAGTITIGPTPLSAVDATGWRSQVAWVPQRPHLFHGTVAQNIRLARASATDADVIAAARAAHAHDFIVGLTDGYETQIGERGARLSGGEQQRIAIARAFLKDAPFLILDEATSHLDEENEALIRESLKRLMLNRTVLLITHRMELARHADHVAVIRDGRVVRAGPPRLVLSPQEVGAK